MPKKAAELIIELVASSFLISLSDLKSRKRDVTTALARQVAMYLIRQETDCSLAKIGQVLGGRSPATVSYAYQKIAEHMSNNSGMKRKIVELQIEIFKESESPQLLKKLKPEEVNGLDALIRFHRDGLAQCRQYMSPSSQYLEGETIKALEELKKLLSAK